MRILFRAHPAGSDADAELIRVCGEYHALQRQYSALCDGPDRIHDDDQCELAVRPLRHAMGQLLPQLRSLRATTLEGFHARAKVLMKDNFVDQEIDPLRDAESEYHNVCLMAVLLRDLATSAGVSLRAQSHVRGRA